MTRWLLSTIGKRGYIADYLRASARDLNQPCHIIGTGSESFTPGFARCDAAVIVPPYTDSGYLDAVLAVAAEHQVDAMLSFADPDVAALATIRPTLQAMGVACFFPGHAAALAGFDKLLTATRAVELGLPTPCTALPSERASLGWPRVWKPRSGSASAGVRRVVEPEEELGIEPEGMIVQECVFGEEIDVELLCDLGSTVVRTSAWRKMRSRNGETECAVTTSGHQELVEHSIAFAEAVGLVGPVDFDWIVGPDGPWLIEVNTRFGGGYPVSHLAGAGFTDALVRLARGEDLEREDLASPDVYMMKQLQPFGGPASQIGELLHLEGDALDGGLA